MESYRLRFEKTGRAVYISHLDLMRTMQRAFLRAELPLAYSEGFNPHARISVLLPLSVGTGSLCELMDFSLREETDPDTIPRRLNAVLPEGIRALEVRPALVKGRELKWLRVTGRLEYDDPARLAGMAERLNAFFSGETLVIRRKTKRGEGESDIRPAIREISFAPTGEHIRMEAVISAQEPTLNPELLADALRQLAPELAPDFAAFCRIETYREDMQIFR